MSGFRIHITPAFRIETDLLRFSFSLQDKDYATARRQAGSVEVLLPRALDYTAPRPAQWLYNIAAEEMRRQARAYLPGRLAALAAQHGFDYGGVTLKNIASRWGSCSGRKHINLNIWLIAVPSHLIDYVLLHELCHLREMNHGPRFWAEVDACTGGRGKALEREMKKYGRRLLAAE